MRKRWELGNLLGVLRPQAVPEIPVRLKLEPEIGTHASDLCKAEWRIGCDRALGANDFVQARKSDSQSDSERRLRDAERHQKVLKQDLAGRGRRKRRRQPPRDQSASGRLGALSDSP
jgi:hypothetical protein